MNIYQLDHDWQQIQDQLEELDGSDLTPELEEQIVNLLNQSETLSKDWYAKIDGYCKLIAMLSAQATIRGQEATRLANLAESDNSKVNKLKDRLKESLQMRGQKKIKTNLFNLSICKNGGKVPLILPKSVDSLPPEFVQTIREPNKDEIRTALENGDAIEGCYLGERGTRLSIK